MVEIKKRAGIDKTIKVCDFTIAFKLMLTSVVRISGHVETTYDAHKYPTQLQ
jgi:hypothetical protein